MQRSPPELVMDPCLPSPRLPRTWLITGASGGVGLLVAESALALGDRVVLVGADTAVLQDLVDGYPGQAWALELDITSPEDAEALAASVAQREHHVDVLVHAAGLDVPRALAVETDEELQRQLGIRVFGPLRLIRALLPLLGGEPTATLVLVAFELHTEQSRVRAACPSRFVLEALTDSLAVELRPLGLRVLLAEPGGVRTGCREGNWWTWDGSAHGGQDPGEQEAAAEAIVAAITRPPAQAQRSGHRALAPMQQRLKHLHEELTSWANVDRRVRRRARESAAVHPRLGLRCATAHARAPDRLCTGTRSWP
jgi:NAD(P)-dependent dehydrogenase (short-subunit alcohol dehydrogenase family)